MHETDLILIPDTSDGPSILSGVIPEYRIKFQAQRGMASYKSQNEQGRAVSASGGRINFNPPTKVQATPLQESKIKISSRSRVAAYVRKASCSPRRPAASGKKHRVLSSLKNQLLTCHPGYGLPSKWQLWPQNNLAYT